MVQAAGLWGPCRMEGHALAFAPCSLTDGRLVASVRDYAYMFLHTVRRVTCSCCPTCRVLLQGTWGSGQAMSPAPLFPANHLAGLMASAMVTSGFPSWGTFSQV